MKIFDRPRIALTSDAMKKFQRFKRLVMLLLLSAGALPSAHAVGNQPLLCVAPQKNAQVALNQRVDELRVSNSLYQQMVRWNGAPSACKGQIGNGPAYGESRLELSWLNGAVFAMSTMLPEIAVVRVDRPGGLGHAGKWMAALRADARQRGLHIDWATPHQETDGDLRVVEYRDPDQGVNGIVRLSYDRQGRLVRVSLSTSL